MDPVAFPIDLFWGCPQRTQDDPDLSQLSPNTQLATKPEPVRQVSERQRGSETTREGQDQIKVRHVWLSF